MEQRSLASYIPPGCKESDVTERLTQSSGLKNLLLRKIYFKHQPSQLYPSVVVQLLSHVQLFATPWTLACQAPLSMEFSRQEYWSVLSFPSPGDLPNPCCLICFKLLFIFPTKL